MANQYMPDTNTSLPALYENPLLLSKMENLIINNKSAEELVDQLIDKSNQY
jgi:hypothetical protein